MGAKLNPFTGKLESDDLELDQTVPQTVDKGSPEFAQGAAIKRDQKLYLDGN